MEERMTNAGDPRFFALLVHTLLSAMMGLMIALRWFSFLWVSQLGTWCFCLAGVRRLRSGGRT